MHLSNEGYLMILAFAGLFYFNYRSDKKEALKKQKQEEDKKTKLYRQKAKLKAELINTDLNSTKGFFRLFRLSMKSLAVAKKEFEIKKDSPEFKEHCEIEIEKRRRKHELGVIKLYKSNTTIRENLKDVERQGVFTRINPQDDVINEKDLKIKKNKSLYYKHAKGRIFASCMNLENHYNINQDDLLTYDEFLKTLNIKEFEVSKIDEYYAMQKHIFYKRLMPTFDGYLNPKEKFEMFVSIHYKPPTPQQRRIIRKIKKARKEFLKTYFGI